ncbi:AraC family transcriptional regulator [Flavobacterium sp. SLB02]|uniref:helix-turn-helix domain-containing protein n=1 Tax=Flavobacterium sp. SLB02 TaxID=2665645 RepID=UPI0012A93C16|nr:helix-turn-helix domain-containing protein [Flavobacterium sp. SLB02]QGK73472.1 helix-turn-helix domain-containing protein [Flavobacterium sp. SLB02]
MIKDLINTELKDFPKEGLNIYIIKKYVVKTSSNESFLVRNYAVVLIKSGEFKIRIKEFTSELRARDLMVLSKDSYCSIFEVKGKLQLFLICFTSGFAFENCLKKELVDSFAFLLGDSSSKISLEDKDFQVLSLIYKLIYFVNKDSRLSVEDSELQRIGFDLFLHELKFIFNRYSTGNPFKINRHQNLTVQFLTILTIHCKKQHRVKFYAGALFVTRGYLNNVVRKVTGKTTKSLIDQAIINEIKNVLENSPSSITLIAQDFEFSSLSKLSNFFKRYTTMSPSQYRNITVGRFKNL